jgi:hypothetical protein
MGLLLVCTCFMNAYLQTGRQLDERMITKIWSYVVCDLDRVRA